jgi:hypothetical protein
MDNDLNRIMNMNLFCRLHIENFQRRPVMLSPFIPDSERRAPHITEPQVLQQALSSLVILPRLNGVAREDWWRNIQKVAPLEK